MESQYNSHTFFIKQHSTLPEVKFPLNQRILEKYDITEDMMDNVAVTFSMYDSYTGEYEIANTPAKLLLADNDDYEKLDEARYTLAYRFKLHETEKTGRYLAEFKLDFLGEEYCGKITFPTDKAINIIIGKSSTKTTVV